MTAYVSNICYLDQALVMHGRPRVKGEDPLLVSQAITKRRIWEAQGRKCADCERPLAFEDAELDHDHRRGAIHNPRKCPGYVRGVVCHSCNVKRVDQPTKKEHPRGPNQDVPRGPPKAGRGRTLVRALYDVQAGVAVQQGPRRASLRRVSQEGPPYVNYSGRTSLRSSMRANDPERTHAYLIEDPEERNAIVARNVRTLHQVQGYDRDVVARLLELPRSRVDEILDAQPTKW